MTWDHCPRQGPLCGSREGSSGLLTLAVCTVHGNVAAAPDGSSLGFLLTCGASWVGSPGGQVGPSHVPVAISGQPGQEPVTKRRRLCG